MCCAAHSVLRKNYPARNASKRQNSVQKNYAQNNSANIIFFPYCNTWSCCWNKQKKIMCTLWHPLKKWTLLQFLIKCFLSNFCNHQRGMYAVHIIFLFSYCNTRSCCWINKKKSNVNTLALLDQVNTFTVLDQVVFVVVL